MFPRIRNLLFWLSIGTFTLAACAPAQPAASPSPAAQTSAGQLTPYTAPSATASPRPVKANPATATPLPSPTPTPRTHTVKKGEDLGGIAFRYRVSLQELMEANPKVNPNIMSVGTVLVIPASKTPMPPGGPSADASAEAPTPTAIPVQAGKMNCSRAADGGVWCFLPVKNNQPFPLESLSAIFRLADKNAKTVLPQTAFLPLDTLAPGSSLPLAAYFPPEQTAGLAQPYQFSSEMLTALPSADDGRYVATQINNQKVFLAEDGLSATVTAEVTLQDAGKAQRVWVAAAAYDTQGRVVGVRRWENDAAHPLESGQALPVTIRIYSVGQKIARVELTAEARP